MSGELYLVLSIIVIVAYLLITSETVRDNVADRGMYLGDVLESTSDAMNRIVEDSITALDEAEQRAKEMFK